VKASAQVYAREDSAERYARHRSALAYVIEILDRLREKSPRGAMLEIGCGTAVYAAALADAHAHPVYAMDLSLHMLRQTVAHDGVARMQGHAARLPFAARSFAMIFSVNVIHHMREVAAYFRECSRVLKPGGILCTATDSRAIIERRNPLSRYWPATVPVELGRYHDLQSLRAQMQSAGFRRLQECEGRAEFSITDADAYRDKAFSCLQLISTEDFARGLAAMESDLRLGPLKGASELAFLWAERV
jgi:ubiquinone/menaquinone biosynthesis C-methylase UbiE